ncbi:30S ribosomal protein S1 [compost metagenome]
MISGKVKGGLTVMVNGIRAFLPGSLVDVRPVKDTTPYEGKEVEFKVIKLDRKRNNVVVSRRAVLEETLGEERKALLETLREGLVVRGIVKNITDYGAFVEPRFAGSQAAGRRSVGGSVPPLPCRHPPVRQGNQPDRLRWLC